MNAMKWMDKAIERFDEVWGIFKLVDWENCRKQSEKLAFQKHVELLKKNRDILAKVRNTAELMREYMTGFSLIYAIGITQILETIKEGDERFYLNLKFTKKEGKVRAEKVGWDWAEEVF